MSAVLQVYEGERQTREDMFQIFTKSLHKILDIAQNARFAQGSKFNGLKGDRLKHRADCVSTTTACFLSAFPATVLRKNKT